MENRERIEEEVLVEEEVFAHARGTSLPQSVLAGSPEQAKLKEVTRDQKTPNRPKSRDDRMSDIEEITLPEEVAYLPRSVKEPEQGQGKKSPDETSPGEEKVQMAGRPATPSPIVRMEEEIVFEDLAGEDLKVAPGPLENEEYQEQVSRPVEDENREHPPSASGSSWQKNGGEPQGKGIVDILSEKGWLDKKKREDLEAEAMVDDKRRSWEIAVERGYVSSKMMAEAMAEAYRIQFIPTKTLFEKVNRKVLMGHLEIFSGLEALPLIDGGLAITSPIHANTVIKAVKKIEGLSDPSVHVADQGDVLMILGEAHASIRISVTKVTEFIRRNKSDIVRILDYLLEIAIQHRASDIHFEPHGSSAMVRLRIHGDLETMAYLPTETYRKVITALTTRSKVAVQNRSKDMDGSFEHEVGKHKIQMRCGFFPTVHDLHAVVVRIQDTRHIQYRLETLGYDEDDVSNLLRIARNLSSGIILITGPTGAGKSASVHGVTAEMDLETKKIYEVSDPVEYRTPKGVQSQVYKVNQESKWDFGDAGRSLKRMDPNVFYLGEIRDNESATESIVNARTGILVISTLHTTRAFDTFKRLQDLGVSVMDLIDVLKIVMNQRLMKRLCPSCRVLRPVTKDDRVGLFEDLLKDVQHVWEAAPDGTECDACGDRGYTGRYAIAEIVYMNSSFKKVLMENPNVGGEMLEMEYNRKSGGGKGWMSIYEKAIRDAQSGKTSMSMVIKTLGVL